MKASKHRFVFALLTAFLLSLGSSTSATQTTSAGLATGQASGHGEPHALTAVRAEDWQRFSVTPSGPIKFDLKGFSVMYGGSGYISPIPIRIQYYMTDGKEYWLLVPFTETGRLDGRELDTADFARSEFIGVNYASGEIFPRIVLLKLTWSDHTLKANNKSLVFSREIQFRSMASIKREGFFTAEESQQALVNSESLVRQRERATAEANLPVVTKIGARICKNAGAVVFVGFTEGRSPDNEKIQIRVSDAFYQGHPSLRPEGFVPSITWDYPSQWQPCE